jgi:hypoxanthine phosphoribosyltransferase
VNNAEHEVIATAEQIAGAVGRMAAAISADHPDGRLVVVGVLTGSVFLVADLVRRLTVPCRIEMVRASSYRGQATSPGELAVDVDADLDLAGRHVVLVDDILDTGQTLSTLAQRLRALGAEQVRVAVLLRKLGRQTAPLTPDYCGLDIPNRFVVGYGLDHDGRYRYLPHIAAID